MDALARQNIEVFANYLYEIEGCPKGRSRDFWFSAEQQLKEIIFEEDYSTSSPSKESSRKASK